jgi:tRNA (cmo5U34)-methyltransferase
MRRWGEKEFSLRYLEEADIRIPERRRMLEVLKTFFGHFAAGRENVSILDIGCGDGVLTHEMLSVDSTMSSTLIDGSPEMVKRAEERLAGYAGLTFHVITLQELAAGKLDLGRFDFAVSSLAIHHLNAVEKRALFDYLYSHLNEGSYFVNFDVILAPTSSLEEWYVQLWREWMADKERELGLESTCEGVIGCCQEEEHRSRLDTLDAQTDALRGVGFRDVDCYYKYGIFAMYGGRK